MTVSTLIADQRSDDVIARPPVDSAGVDPIELMRMITASDGVPVHDRILSQRRYPACFEAAEFVTFVGRRLSCSRSQAVRLGRRLVSLGLIRSIPGEHDFSDGAGLYAFTRFDATSATADQPLPAAVLAKLAAAMRGQGGVHVGSHRFRLVRYPNTFLGSAATDWLCDRTGESRQRAVRIGNAMLRANHFRHVFDEVDFRDGHFFYRFL